jgi:hypothetical protein
MSLTPTEHEVRAYVGSNADYYLKAWQPGLTGDGGASGFNIAAFFLSSLWLGYRKMYMAVLILFGIILAEIVLEELLFVGILKMREAPPGVSLLVGLIVAIVVGIGANRWYLAQARRVIGEVRSQGLQEEAHLKTLSSRGGTSLGASLGLFALFAVAAGVLGVVLAGPHGQF